MTNQYCHRIPSNPTKKRGSNESFTKKLKYKNTRDR